jgi:hypothetical protein
MLRVAQKITTVDRLRACYRLTATESSAVIISQADESGAYYANLCVCGNVWCCPVCSAKILAKRADQISRGLASHIVGGGEAWMVTFTLRHDWHHGLDELFDALSDGFTRLGNGKAAKKEREATRLVGTINSREITYRRGWHPHLHVVVLFEEAPDPLALAKLIKRWERVWLAWTAKQGFPADARHGIDWTKVVTAADAGEYLAKAQDSGRTIGAEVARGDLKRGRLGSLTPFELLEYVDRTGDKAGVDLWREYEKATTGKRRHRIRWSNGLRALLLPDEDEKSDEDLAQEDRKGRAVALIGVETWKAIVDAGLEARVLEAIDRGGFLGLVQLLTAWRIGTSGVCEPDAES